MDLTRDLAAIMFTDMVASSYVMNKDEEFGYGLVKGCHAVQEDLISKYNGVLLKNIGDGLLSRFRSTIAAVQCAIEIQNHFKNDKDIVLRVGIHVGDVINETNDVSGNTVNVAKRIENLARKGSILISDVAYGTISDRKGILFNHLGNKVLKGFQESIGLYEVVAKEETKDVSSLASHTKNRNFKKHLVAAILLIVTVTFGIIAIKNLFTYKIVDERNGISYPIVVIDSLEWLGKNLNYDSGRDSARCYDNKESNCRRYGRLYTWNAASKACSGLGLGWRLPTKDEFKIIVDSVNADFSKPHFRRMLGGESDAPGTFIDQGVTGIIWSSTESKAGAVWIFYMNANGKNADMLDYGSKSSGYSCRCVRRIGEHRDESME